MSKIHVHARALIAGSMVLAVVPSLAVGEAEFRPARKGAKAMPRTTTPDAGTSKPQLRLTRQQRVARAIASLRKARATGRKRGRAGVMWPVMGVVTSDYGPRRLGSHHGIDMLCRAGAPVYAARGGQVLFSGVLPYYGKAVILRHSRYFTTLYGHLHLRAVRRGETVRANQAIGACGSTGRSTGPHLHFETRIGGRALNPARFLPRGRTS